jgi:hypothetical protein
MRGREVRDITFNGGGGGKREISVMKVPRLCPLLLLVKVGRREGRAFGSGEGVMISGVRKII